MCFRFTNGFEVHELVKFVDEPEEGVGVLPVWLKEESKGESLFSNDCFAS
jgi:hypothetical protein